MRKFVSIALVGGVLASVVFGLPQAALAQGAGGPIDVQNCQVILIKDPTLYATKPGRLTMAPEEGDPVEKDQVVAKIDDTEALLSLHAARVERDVAAEQAKNDVDIRFAEAQELVTGAEVAEAKAANRKAAGAMSDSEIRRREFQHQRSGLATEQAKRDHKMAAMQVKVANAKMQAAKHEWETRQVRSEINGVVSERFMQVGEWVNAGDPIAKLIQLDKVRVLGYVDANLVSRNDVLDKPVTIHIRLAGPDAPEQLSGQITHAGFEVDQAGTYKVWADIDNQMDATGHYKIHPGCNARMVIGSRGRLDISSGGGTQFMPAPGR